MCRSDFERRIFHDTYQEFREQSKAFHFTADLHTFSQMCVANQMANSLSQKLDHSVTKVIETLNHKMPILNDENGQPILFNSAKLRIYSSDLLNKAAHVVSITYTSKKLVLYEVVNNLLILSYDIKGQFNEPFIVMMNDDLVLHYDRINAELYS